MTTNFQIRGTKENPYHLSVGAVIIEDNNIILLKKKDGLFTLPRETIFIQESISTTLIRGVQEEVGIIIKVEKYLGSQISYFKRPDDTTIEKTTLYFLATKQKDSVKAQEQDELDDTVVMLGIKEALNLLKSQNNLEWEILQKIEI